MQNIFYVVFIVIIFYMVFIVASSAKEPIVGWIDNFNGFVGILTASAKGIMHVAWIHKNANPDFIPVDISIKAMIVAAYHRGINKY